MDSSCRLGHARATCFNPMTVSRSPDRPFPTSPSSVMGGRSVQKLFVDLLSGRFAGVQWTVTPTCDEWF